MPGYCDPPVEHRFKKGQSGNPKGGPRGPHRPRVGRRSDYLDARIRCIIGGKRFDGSRREALVQFATRIAIHQKDLALQRLVLDHKRSVDQLQSHILRDETFFYINDFPSSEHWVSCIEDAADVTGFGKKAYRKQKTARVLLESWVIEKALINLCGKRLGREEQEQVLEAARFPKTVNWPDWWEPDLRERGKGWRAKHKPEIKCPTPQPEVVRMHIRDYLRAKQEEEGRRSRREMERELRGRGPL